MANQRLADVSEFVKLLLDRRSGLFKGVRELTVRVQAHYPEMPHTGLQNLLRSGALAARHLPDLTEALALSFDFRRHPEFDAHYRRIFRLDPDTARLRAFEHPGYAAISRPPDLAFVDERLEGDYLIYRANETGGVSRSGLRIRALDKDPGMRTQTVRLDGPLAKISTQGRLIRQEQQYLMAAYTRRPEALFASGAHFDGGASIMVLPHKMIGDEEINRDKVVILCGIHLQATYEFPANFSKVVVVRYDDYREVDGFKEWYELLAKRYNERIAISEAAKELSVRTSIDERFFYFSQDRVEGGALVNTATTGEAITVSDEIDINYLPGSNYN